jgi:hypothetical protein
LNGVSKWLVNVSLWGSTLPILQWTEIGNDLTVMQERLLQRELGEAYRPYCLTAKARLRRARQSFGGTGARPAR